MLTVDIFIYSLKTAYLRIYKAKLMPGYLAKFAKPVSIVTKCGEL